MYVHKHVSSHSSACVSKGMRMGVRQVRMGASATQNDLGQQTASRTT